MIAALLLAAALPQVAGLPDDPRARAMAGKLQRIRLATRVNDEGAVTRCAVRRSSGDRAFDAGACDAVRTCAELGEGTKNSTDACMREQLMKLAVRRELGR